MADNPRIEELRRRVESDPASIAFAALAEEYRRTGRHDEAIDICRMGLQRHPAYLSARVTLGRALIEVGDFEGARAELETVLKAAPENLAAIRGLAQIHERLGHSTEMHPDLAALAAQPLPVSEPPAPDLRGPAYTERSAALDLRGPAYTERSAAPDLRGPAYTERSAAPDLRGPAYTEGSAAPDAGSPVHISPATQPLKIDLPDTAGGHTELEIDLPTPSAVHQTLNVDLPLEGGATDGFKIDIPSVPDSNNDTYRELELAPVPVAPMPAVAATPTAAPDRPHDSALERLEHFLVAVQHARSGAADASAPLRSGPGGGGGLQR